MDKLDKKKVLFADLSLLLVAAVWGGGFVAVKDALDNISPFYMMSMRFSIASILMCLIFWKKIKNIKKQDLVAGLVIGVILFSAFAFQTVGLQYTTAGKQSFVTAVYVVMVPFLYWIVSRKTPGKYNVISAFICLVGIGFLTLNSNEGLVLGKGDILTLVCALLFAAHIVAVGHYAEKCDPVILTILQLGVSAIISICFAIVLEKPPVSMGKEAIIPIIYLAVFSTFVAYLVQNVAQKYTYSTHAALIMCLESVFGSVLSVIILGEDFTLKMVFGCIMIFTAIIISETELDFLKRKGVDIDSAAD